MEPYDFIWVEKYRPHKVADLILPTDLKNTFQSIVDQGSIPNMILSGLPGVGKTSVALAMCDELGTDHILINGSLERNIDTLRYKIINYASSVSLTGGRKVVIIDEADHLNPESTQPAFRGVIEEFAGNCSFVFTVNYKNRIIPPLQSRCSVIDFLVPKEQIPTIAISMFKRVIEILTLEGVTYDKAAVVALVKRHFPDFRRTINELQRYSVNGKIDVGILSTVGDQKIDELFNHLRAKDWQAMRRWVSSNCEQDSGVIFKALFDHVYDIVKPAYVPMLVTMLGKWQYQDAMVVNKEINLAAALSEIMIECEMKEGT